MARWKTGSIGAITLVLATSACHPERSAAAPSRTTAAPAPTMAFPVVTDESLASALHDRMKTDGLLVRGDIAVSAAAGVVTLAGTVATLRQRDRAVAITESFRGVRSIIDRLDVVPGHAASDDVIRNEVRGRLQISPGLREPKIDVTVSSGRVQLEGVVTSWVLRSRIDEVARSISGVRAVVDDVRVVPDTSRSDGEISRDVNYRLANDVSLGGLVVASQVRDGVVDIAGNVGSLAEKRRAVALGWVAGAKSVDARGVLVDWLRYDSRRRTLPARATSDGELRETVLRAISLDPRFEHAPGVAAIEVTVKDGVATLAGKVPAAEQRFAAEADAASTVGVRNVVNHIAVEPSAVRSDADLEKDARETLSSSPVYEDARELRTTVAAGVVHLTGAVPTAADRGELERLAWEVPGVRLVQNDLAVTTPSPTPPLEIRRRILHALAWDTRVEPTHIAVIVDADRRAVLTGTVPSFDAQRAAIDDAVDAGSAGVVDLLSVR